MANESKCGLCPKLGRTALIDEEGHPANHRAKTVLRTIPLRGVGRGDWIRTSDPHTPSVMRYQAALRPDRGFPSKYYFDGCPEGRKIGREAGRERVCQDG